MSVQVQSAVSPNFAEFLLDSAVDGNEILAVLDDIAEVSDTALWCDSSQTEHQMPHKGHFYFIINKSNDFNPMGDYEDNILQDIMDSPAELYDIPELQDKKFDVEDYLKGEIDYA